MIFFLRSSTKETDHDLYYFYQTKPWNVSEGGTIARLYNDNLASTKISVPSLEKQREIILLMNLKINKKN